MIEQETTPQRRKLRFWHIALVLLAVLAVAFGVFRIAVRAKLQSKIKAIHAAGYPVTYAELDGWYTIPLYADNAADYITTALTYLGIPTGEEAEGIPLFSKTQLPPRTEPLDDQTQALVARLIGDNEETLGLLHDAASIPDCRYPIDLSLGHGTLLPHISQMRDAARLLALEATLSAERNESEAATQAVLSGYGLARSLLREPLIISQMVRCACDALSTQTLERVLNRVELTDAQLARLEAAVEDSYDPNAFARAFAGERCFVLETYRDPSAVGVRGPPAVLWEVSRALGLMDLSLIRFLHYAVAHMEIAQTEPHRRQEGVAAIEAKQKTGSRLSSLLNSLAPVFGRVTTTELNDIARFHIARTAVAIERHRLAYDRLPQTLADLTPAFLEQVPDDPFDGQPLRYRKLDPGYVVYSVGPDSTDDAGQERQPRRHGGEPPYDITFIVER